MASTTRVILITGFLGSGKTTLLNRLVADVPKSKKLVVLLNEFGEVGVDGALLEGTDLDVMEISKGSIFCVCVKTDFIRGLHELATTLNPDYLLIEATGAANPESLRRDLNLPIFKGRFELAEQICLIDALNFTEQYEIFSSVEKQIASSTIFIINKTDLAGPETILEIRGLIAKHHPDPKVFEAEYSRLDPAVFFPDDSLKAEDSTADEAPVSEEDLEKFIDQLLESPSQDMSPPDILVSAVYEWRGANVDDFRSAMKMLPEKIVRAKGLINTGSGIQLFSLTMGRWELIPGPSDNTAPNVVNKVVFIAAPAAMNSVEEWADAHPDFTHYNMDY